MERSRLGLIVAAWLTAEQILGLIEGGQSASPRYTRSLLPAPHAHEINQDSFLFHYHPPCSGRSIDSSGGSSGGGGTEPPAAAASSSLESAVDDAHGDGRWRRRRRRQQQEAQHGVERRQQRQEQQGGGGGGGGWERADGGPSSRRLRRRRRNRRYVRAATILAMVECKQQFGEREGREGQKTSRDGR